MVPIRVEIKTGFLDPFEARQGAGLLESFAPLQGGLAELFERGALTCS